ncbi:MAG TPA: ATP-binding protein [Xanthomonadaceae bacterium]|nr:ATP-binding protein [Xanthomonadaceae bacterium]
MRLRSQLLLLAGVTLVLPWAGWQFARELEAGLREGQAAALTDSANALAAVVAAQRPALPPAGPVLFVHELDTPVRIDGSGGDWIDVWPQAQGFGDGPGRLRVALGQYGAALHLYARADLAAGTQPAAAQLRVVLDRGNGLRDLRLELREDGRILEAGAPAQDAVVAMPGRWRLDESTVELELRLGPTPLPRRMGLSWGSAAHEPVGTEPDRLGGLWPVVTSVPALQRMAVQLAPPGLRLELAHPDGWTLARAGSLAAGRAQPPSALQGLLHRLLALGERRADPAAGAALVEQAREAPASAWWRESDGLQLKLAAAVPVAIEGETRAVLVLERRSEAALLAQRALSGLIGVTLLAMLAVGGVLLAWATWLSWRVRQLMHAVDRAMDADPGARVRLEASAANDELGELSRRFARLLDEVSGYTEYLRTLAGKLSHELNTPLAIVRSSLENIDGQAVPAPAATYLERARDGTDRLFAIVRAMSEATRVERAIAAAEAEEFDLAALVAGCAEGYRDLVAPRRIELLLPTGPLRLRGAPELLAQALDKLVDNARGFCPPEGWIAIALARHGAGAEIAVANSGPPLPAAARERLFDSLVSLRAESQRNGATPHLGLGLYIVRLIAELHRGEAYARDLPDGNGVEFRLRLRGMP